MKTKKIVLALVIIVLVAGFGFAKGETDSGAAAPKQKALNEMYVEFAQDTLNQPWRNYQAQSIKNELEKAGVKAGISDGGGQAQKQIQNIEDALTKGLDMLMASPAQEGPLTQVISEAYKSGIPVVLADRGITSKDYTCFVHTDNYALATLNAEYIVEKLTQKYGSPKGNIVVIEGVPGASTTVERGDGFKRYLEKYPDIKIVASQPANFRRDMGQKVMEDFLQAYAQIDAVFVMADESAMGAILAIEAAGRRNEMLICSINGTTEGIKAIIDGRMDTTPLYTNASGPAVEFALKILKGEKVPKEVIIEPIMINETNATEMYFADQYSPDPMPIAKSKYREIN